MKIKITLRGPLAPLVKRRVSRLGRSMGVQRVHEGGAPFEVWSPIMMGLARMGFVSPYWDEREEPKGRAAATAEWTLAEDPAEGLAQQIQDLVARFGRGHGISAEVQIG